MAEPHRDFYLDELKDLPAPTLTEIKYGPHERHVLDLWKASKTRITPAAVWIHGGGFRGGQKGLRRSLLEKCLEHGVSVVTISYRYSTQAIFPASFEDGVRAVQFVRLHASEWGLDPQKLAAAGNSAGAGITEWIGFRKDAADPKNPDPLLRQSTRLTCMVLLDGQSSYDSFFIKDLLPGDAYKCSALADLFGVDLEHLETIPKDKRELMRQSTFINYVTKDAPPVLMVYTSSFDPGQAAKDVNMGIHHALFGKALKERLDSLKIENRIYAGLAMDDAGLERKFTLIADFLKEKLIPV